MVKPTDLEAEIEMEFLSCSQGGTTLGVNASGGNGFLDYNWSDNSYESTISFAQAGEYFVWVKDGEGVYRPVSMCIEVTEDLECIEIPNTFHT